MRKKMFSHEIKTKLTLKKIKYIKRRNLKREDMYIISTI